MTTQVCVEPLADHPQMLTTLAQWTYAEWGHFDASNSLQKTEERFRERMKRDELPIAFVAFNESGVLGCACIKCGDLEEKFPQARHWLGSMFVGEHFRRQGVGSKLMSYVFEQCSRLGVQDLYLWTEKAEGFYKRYGFQPLDRFHHLNQDIVVMSKPLGALGAG